LSREGGKFLKILPFSVLDGPTLLLFTSFCFRILIVGIISERERGDSLRWGGMSFCSADTIRYFVEKGKECEEGSPHEARAWLLTGSSLSPANFNLQVNTPKTHSNLIHPWHMSDLDTVETDAELLST
jgi:hypothetical protein